MLDLREMIVQALHSDGGVDLQLGGRVVQLGSMPVEFKERPFALVKFGIDVPHFRWRQGPVDHLVEVWVHDSPGDYHRIDALIELIKIAFDKLPSREEFLESRFVSTSADFEDPDLGTIFKVARFQITTTK